MVLHLEITGKDANGEVLAVTVSRMSTSGSSSSGIGFRGPFRYHEQLGKIWST
jgi:hypothetical protein